MTFPPEPYKNSDALCPVCVWLAWSELVVGARPLSLATAEARMKYCAGVGVVDALMLVSSIRSSVCTSGHNDVFMPVNRIQLSSARSDKRYRV